MTDDDDVIAGFEVAEAVLVYRSMTPDELRRMRTAFQTDRAHATTDIQRRFCDSRLAMIEQVLRSFN